jgi:hypothetical protein
VASEKAVQIEAKKELLNVCVFFSKFVFNKGVIFIFIASSIRASLIFFIYCRRLMLVAAFRCPYKINSHGGTTPFN